MSKSKCRKCAHWGVGMNDRTRATATWLVCDVPQPMHDMPVREWVLDEVGRRVRMRWKETGETLKGAGGGKPLPSHAEHSCAEFTRRPLQARRPPRAQAPARAGL